MKTISTYDKTFVFGIFDCCRNEVKEKKQATKGGPAKPEDDDSDEGADDAPQRRATNCIFLYRCRP